MAAITVDPAMMASVLESWETGDIMDFEDQTGFLFGDLMAIFENAVPGAELVGVPFKVMVGFAWMVKRIDDRSVTFDEAKHWKLTELKDILDPTSRAPLKPLDAPVKRRAKAS